MPKSAQSGIVIKLHSTLTNSPTLVEIEAEGTFLDLKKTIERDYLIFNLDSHTVGLSSITMNGTQKFVFTNKDAIRQYKEYKESWESQGQLFNAFVESQFIQQSLKDDDNVVVLLDKNGNIEQEITIDTKLCECEALSISQKIHVNIDAVKDISGFVTEVFETQRSALKLVNDNEDIGAKTIEDRQKEIESFLRNKLEEVQNRGSTALWVQSINIILNNIKKMEIKRAPSGNGFLCKPTYLQQIPLQRSFYQWIAHKKEEYVADTSVLPLINRCMQNCMQATTFHESKWDEMKHFIKHDAQKFINMQSRNHEQLARTYQKRTGYTLPAYVSKQLQDIIKNSPENVKKNLLNAERQLAALTITSDGRTSYNTIEANIIAILTATQQAIEKLPKTQDTQDKLKEIIKKLYP